MNLKTRQEVEEKLTEWECKYSRFGVRVAWVIENTFGLLAIDEPEEVAWDWIIEISVNVKMKLSTAITNEVILRLAVMACVTGIRVSIASTGNLGWLKITFYNIEKTSPDNVHPDYTLLEALENKFSNAWRSDFGV